MITSEPKARERVLDVRVAEDAVSVDLYDGKTIAAPLAWFPRLLHATPEQRANWRVAGAGYGIHWPDIDEGSLAPLQSEHLRAAGPSVVFVPFLVERQRDPQKAGTLSLNSLPLPEPLLACSLSDRVRRRLG